MDATTQTERSEDELDTLSVAIPALAAGLFGDRPTGAEYSPELDEQELERRASQLVEKNAQRDEAFVSLLRFSGRLHAEYRIHGTDTKKLRSAVACFCTALRDAGELGTAQIELAAEPICQRCYETGNKQQADVDAAVDATRAVFSYCQRKHLEDARDSELRDFYWQALGDRLSTLIHRYTIWRHARDADEVLELFRAVESWTGIEPELRWLVFSLVSQMLAQRYFASWDAKDIAEAIKAAQDALTPIPTSAYHHAMLLRNLCGLFKARYMGAKESSDLDEALETARSALNLDGISEHVRAQCLAQLAGTLLQRHLSRNESKDIDDAIVCLEEALELSRQAEDADRAPLLVQTALAYMARNDMAELFDIDSAIRHAREAVHLKSTGGATQHMAFDILTEAISSRLSRKPDKSTCEEAVRMVRDAFAALPADDVDRTLPFLHILGRLLQTEYEQTRNRGALDESIKYARESVKLCPEDGRMRPTVLHDLGRRLYCLFEATGEKTHLDAAIARFKSATDCPPPKGVTADGLLYKDAYATALLIRSERYADSRQDDLSTALELFLFCFGHVAAHPISRIQCAQYALNILVIKGQWDEAVAVADKALESVPLACRRYMSRDDQQHAIKDISGMAATAASLSLRAGETEKALQQLEFGRCIIYGYAMDSRDGLRALRSTHEHLAHRYDVLRSRLDGDAIEEDGSAASLAHHLANEGGEGGWQLRNEQSQAALLEMRARQRREAPQEIEKCVEEIRKVEGYERFQMPPDIDELKGLANRLSGEGPIVLVNMVAIMADAIILSADGVKRLHLAQMTWDKAPAAVQLKSRDRSSSRLSKGPDLFDSIREFAADEAEEDDDPDPTAALLSWLWTTCVGPILAELDNMGLCGGPYSVEKPRIWWVGCGMASSLPFHAAGVDFSAGSKENALSRAVFSYIPSLKALEFARSCADGPVRESSEASSILLVTMPTTVGHRNLPGVDTEREAIRKACQGTSYSTEELLHPAAADVAGKLPQHSIAHFACHGSSDPSDPSQSHLLLQRHGMASEPPAIDKLTAFAVEQAGASGPPSGGGTHLWLAFLAACRTAEVRATKFADENLHLAGAFQASGFAHVVASLWSVDDDACALVSGAFYRELVATMEKAKKQHVGSGNLKIPGRAVAEALQQAVVQLRDTGCGPEVWAPFVHIGA